MMNNTNDFREELREEVKRAHIEKKAHVKMLEVMASIAPDSLKPLFTLPVKANHAIDKVNDIMMLATHMDDNVEYATKACEFLDRVEEACVAFMEQEQTAGE